jgi:hypothetical protein
MRLTHLQRHTQRKLTVHTKLTGVIMMAARKTYEQKIQELELKKKQTEEKIKKLQQQVNEKERKMRTHRLIEKGAIAEKYFMHSGSQEDFEILLEKIVNIPEVINIIEKYKTE